MNLYLFMGTRLPDILPCLAAVAGEAPEGSRPCAILPEGTDAGSLAACGIRLVNLPLTSLDPEAASHVFVVLDPRESPVPQLELLADELRAVDREPVKVVTCVDCSAAEASPQLRSYLDACIYYSDTVLLGNRSGASKSFVRQFEKGYQQRCYPARFQLLKDPGQPQNPLEILLPGTLRLSQLFDREPLASPDSPAGPIEASCDLDFEEAEEDPYRPSAESGKSALQVPDVGPWIAWS